jgi:polyhydroxybutyrate depolymerase
VKRAAITALVAAACLVPSADAVASCGAAPGRSGSFTIEVGTARRTFVARVPAAADGRTAVPVLFAFHPFGTNAQYMASRVPSRFWPEAILVYPDGFSRPGGPASPSWQNQPGDLGDRDVAFFDGMLAWLREHHCIDDRRVFVMGYSNGAALATVLACVRPQVVAGLATASGRLACTPASPMPAIVSHGTRDTTVGYEQAVASVRAWSQQNGCSAPPAGVNGCVAATSCQSAPVSLCSYPGGHEYNPAFTQLLVDFFKALPAK